MKGISLFFGLTISLFASPCFAQDTGASFLKIGVGARALGMGSAFTATADDATAIFWNPAGLSKLNKKEVSAMHTEWITDIRYDHLAYAQPTRLGTFAGSLAYLSQGTLEKRSETRQKEGNFQAQDSALALSWSRSISVRSSYGINVKWIEQQIDDKKASGAAMDVGFLQKAGRNIDLGLSLQNAGPKLKFIQERYSLPLSVVGGMGYSLGNGLRMGLDIRRYIYDKQTAISVGTEYMLLGRVALRAGYLSQTGRISAASKTTSESTASRLGQFAGVNMGLGLRISNYQMDYALSPSSEFGNTHRLSLSARF